MAGDIAARARLPQEGGGSAALGAIAASPRGRGSHKNSGASRPPSPRPRAQAIHLPCEKKIFRPQYGAAFFTGEGKA